jgi:integrase
LPRRRKPFFISVAPGISLGYRRNIGPGTWLIRRATDKGRSWSKAFAIADDFEDADGERVLDFWQAVDRARELVRGGKNADASKPATVADALDDHDRDLELRGGLVDKVGWLRNRLTPAMLQRPVCLLTARELRKWRDDLRASGLAASTVTRVSKVLAAALSHAATLDPRITNRSAWVQGLQALPDSHRARAGAVLSDDEVRAIVTACYAFAEPLGLLVEVLAVTGARPIQAFRLCVGDLLDARLMMPRSVKGRGVKSIGRRPIPIPPPLIERLRAAAGDRPAGDALLLRPDGRPWKTGNHSQPFALALAAAGLPRVVVYTLRHSSITRSLQRGVPVRIVADAHDTSVAMIERTYGASVADHSETMLRAAQIDLAPSHTDDRVVVPLVKRS